MAEDSQLPKSENLYYKQPNDPVKMQQLWKVMDDLKKGLITATEAIGLLNENAVVPDGVAKGDLIAFNGTDWVIVTAGPDRSLVGYDSTAAAGITDYTPAEVVADGLTATDTDTVAITIAVNDISADVITQMSVTSDVNGVMLDGDEASPGNSEYYGTDGAGVKGFHALPSGGVASVTDDGNGVVSVDNTDTANPVIEFNGVNVDGVTITGDGTSGSPLVAVAPTIPPECLATTGALITHTGAGETIVWASEDLAGLIGNNDVCEIFAESRRTTGAGTLTQNMYFNTVNNSLVGATLIAQVATGGSQTLQNRNHVKWLNVNNSGTSTPTTGIASVFGALPYTFTTNNTTTFYLLLTLTQGTGGDTSTVYKAGILIARV